MTNKNLPTHGSFRTEPLTSKNAIVFVHGIYSNHETFKKMAEEFKNNQHFDSWDLAWFEYDFRQSIEVSGEQLADHLEKQYKHTSVVLVGHSMGGLVGRMAILSGKAKCVTKLFLIGTPNFGAVRTGKMTVAALLALKTGNVFANFLRKPGVLDLTNVSGVFSEYFAKYPERLKNADKVDYITIPGLFFHENRSPMEEGKWGEWEKEQNWFTLTNLGIKVINGFQPVFNIHIELPHDGIVEEISNCMKPPAGRQEAYWSEKFAQIEYPSASEHSTYAHLPHVNARELTHTRIHNDDQIISLVMSIAAAENLDTWYKSVVGGTSTRDDKNLGTQNQKDFLRRIETLDDAKKRLENAELHQKLDKVLNLLATSQDDQKQCK